MRFNKTLICLIGAAMLWATAWTDVPRRMNYQGYVTSSTGTPVDGSVSMAFAIYNAPSGGTLLWSETQTVDVTGGQFSVELGKITPIMAETFADTVCWLGVSIGSDAELTPRTRLVTTAYAFRVGTVDGASGGTINGDAVISGKASIGPGNSNPGISALVVGENDTASGDRSSVAGGLQNVASGQTSNISGGYLNRALGISASVSGGNENHADWHFAHIGGGLRNVSNSWAATVGGGEADSAMGQWSAVPGGAVNKATGDYSFAFGRRAKALHYGTLVWGDGEDADFNSTGPNQFLIRTHGGVGINTNAPTAPLEVGGIIYSNTGGFKFPDGTLQITAASVSGGNADKVDGFDASAAPTANNLLPLDAQGHFVVTGSAALGVIRGYNPIGRGIYGEGSFGVYGSTSGNSPTAGVYGDCTGNSSSTANGVQGLATNTTGAAIGGDFGTTLGGSGYHFGVRANSPANSSVTSRGVQAYASNSGSGDVLAADFWAQTGGTGGHAGILTNAVGGSTAYGILAQASGGSSASWAGYFMGNVNVLGTLSKGAGSFKIDHPLDPANKYLYHSFVESPDMKNIYDGVAFLDAQGQAVVELPQYFEALNGEYRYQLTCIGAYSPVYISQKIANNRFVISGGTLGLEVSWQVTGIRKDAFAQAHRIPVEEVKPSDERGKYLYPLEYGKPASFGIDAETIQNMSTGNK